jgi:hypothetical protein
MPFTSPTPFREALLSQEVRSLLPTTGSAADLARLGPDILKRAVFSARTSSAAHLSRIQDVVMSILRPGGPAGSQVNEARARELLRDSLARIGYQPSDVGAAAGSLRDLGSERRLNLIVDMQVGFARGYGDFAQGQSPAVLDQWPAQELIRVEERQHHRDWHDRWETSGGRLYAGRMVALKNDPVWTEISDFGLPYPPYAYGSGMGVQDVSRGDAESIGLLAPGQMVMPQNAGINDELQAKLPLERQSDLATAILDSMGDDVEFTGGVLRFKR